MTQRVADNDVIATFAKRQHDWMERVLKGSLDPTEVARAVQVLIDRGANCTRLTIDCDASPFTPDGWRVEEHKTGGQLAWSPSCVSLYFADGQRDGKYVNGNALRKVLSFKSTMNANVLDYLLANSHLIPEEWKGKYVFFWGTIYRHAGGSLCVRCLCWDGGRWDWCASWLGGDWHGGDPAALRAS